MFTECEAADFKGFREQEGGSKSRSQALATCINPGGNQRQGHGAEEHPPRTSPARRAGRGWLRAEQRLQPR